LTENWCPFLLVRPCGLPFAEEILADLGALALVPEAQAVVQGWREVSRRLYFDQYGAADTADRLQDGAEAWLTTTVALYGDRAVCLQFARAGDQTRRLAVAARLADYKRQYRRRRRTQRAPISLTFTSGEHTWPVFFDGIHVPEPQPERIRWELDVILAHTRADQEPVCAWNRRG
jgi:hypothetical protein